MQEPDLTTRIELMRSLFGKHCQAHNLLRDKTGTSTGKYLSSIIVQCCSDKLIHLC
jgi:hypothetical protein